MTGSQPNATHDWSIEALVRIVEEHGSASVSPMLTRRFRIGEECVMVQWGVAGQAVDRDAWWTSFDIDGAFIVPAAKVEVVRFIRAGCPYCPHVASQHEEFGCLVESISGRSSTWIPERCECSEPWGGLPAPRDDAELQARARMEDER
jgi:hypothetical protein